MQSDPGINAEIQNPGQSMAKSHLSLLSEEVITLLDNPSTGYLSLSVIEGNIVMPGQILSNGDYKMQLSQGECLFEMARLAHFSISAPVVWTRSSLFIDSR